MNTNPSTGPRPEDLPPRWAARYDRVAAVAAQLGRLPRRSDRGIDPKDVGWIADQRRALNPTPAQEHALAQMPGWVEGTRDGAWYGRAEQLRSFIELHERRPRVRADVREDRALAGWFSRQHVALLRGHLTDDRARALQYALRKLEGAAIDGPPMNHA